MFGGAEFGKAGEGRRAGAQCEAPPTSPGQTRRGRGNFRSELGEARGGSLGEGAAVSPPPASQPERGEGEADPPRSLPSPLTNSFRSLEPEGRAPLGEGATRGRSHPVWAVGEEAAHRALRSPGSVAECGTRAPSARPGSPRPSGGGGRGVQPGGPWNPSPWELEGRNGRGWTSPGMPGSPRAGREVGGGLFGGPEGRKKVSVGRGQVKKGVIPSAVPDPIVCVAWGPGDPVTRVDYHPDANRSGVHCEDFFVCGVGGLAATWARRPAAPKVGRGRTATKPPWGPEPRARPGRGGGGRPTRLPPPPPLEPWLPNRRFVLASHVSVAFLVVFFFLRSNRN